MPGNTLGNPQETFGELSPEARQQVLLNMICPSNRQVLAYLYLLTHPEPVDAPTLAQNLPHPGATDLSEAKRIGNGFDDRRTPDIAIFVASDTNATIAGSRQFTTTYRARSTGFERDLDLAALGIVLGAAANSGGEPMSLKHMLGQNVSARLALYRTLLERPGEMTGPEVLASLQAEGYKIDPHLLQRGHLDVLDIDAASGRPVIAHKFLPAITHLCGGLNQILVDPVARAQAVEAAEAFMNDPQAIMSFAVAGNRNSA